MLVTILVDGLELATSAFEEGTPLFEGMEFPEADKVLERMSGLMIGSSKKSEQE